MPVGDEDGVRLFVGSEEITQIYQEYSVNLSVFQQPTSFNITVGDGSSIAELRRRFKREDPYELWVHNTKISSGNIDGLSFRGGAARCSFRGRDRMRKLIDGTSTEEVSFQNETYLELTKKILELAGVENPQVSTNNDAARKQFTKVDTKKTAALNEERAEAVQTALQVVRLGLLTFPGTGAERLDTTTIPYTARQVVREARKLKIGTAYWQFLQEQFKKVGLFLWCDPDGNFVLTDPNPYQEPSYQVVRQRGLTRNQVNVVDFSFEDGQPGVHNEIICYGRTGGKKSGRVKCRGDFLNLNIPRTTTLAFEDEGVTSDDEAIYAARRRMAEELRSDYRLTYTLAGHQVLAVNAFTSGIWGPDTVCDVQDDELDIHSPHYLHTVDFTRSVGSGTTTTIHLMRPEDLVFAEAA